MAKKVALLLSQLLRSGIEDVRRLNESGRFTLDMDLYYARDIQYDYENNTGVAEYRCTACLAGAALMSMRQRELGAEDFLPDNEFLNMLHRFNKAKVALNLIRHRMVKGAVGSFYDVEESEVAELSNSGPGWLGEVHSSKIPEFLQDMAELADVIEAWEKRHSIKPVKFPAFVNLLNLPAEPARA